MKQIDFYVKEGQITKDKSAVTLAQRYLDKSKNNLITMQLLSEINTNGKARELLKVPKEYEGDEWIVICGYYAMYTAALALLAKIGYKSKNHAATVLVLEEFFVKKKILDQDTLSILKRTLLHKEEVEKLSDARHKREIAQYSLTKKTTKEMAEGVRKNAYDFVEKCEEIIKNGSIIN